MQSVSCAATARIRISKNALPRCVVALSALVLGACSSPSTKSGEKAPVELLAGFEPLSTPPGGLALYTPIIKGIAPGADQTFCTYTDTLAAEDMFIHKIDGVESPYGHHIVGYYTATPETPRTEECYGQDMTKFRQLLGGSGGEGAFTWTPPSNIGTKVPKGAQFVIQTHWINTGTQDVDAQGMIVTEPAAPGPNRIDAGSVAIVNLSFQIPPQSPGHATVQCTFQKSKRFIMTIGHEHELGTHVKAQVLRATGATELLFDRPFQRSDVFNPPVNDYGEVQPLAFNPGDTVTMNCDWNNTTNSVVGFPKEMCVFFGYTLDSADDICVNGAWAGPSAPGDAGAPDGAPTL